MCSNFQDWDKWLKFYHKCKFFSILVARKIALAFGVSACIAALFLIFYCSNPSRCQDTNIVGPLFMTLFCCLIAILLFRCKELKTRLWNCQFTDCFAIFAFFLIWLNLPFLFQGSFAVLCFLVTNQYYAIAVFALFVCLCVAKAVRKDKNTNSALPSGKHIKDLPVEDILKWAQDDEPSKKDYYGFTPRAQKIVDRLVKNFDSKKYIDKKNAAIGLRGQYGSGKSTITRVIESIVKNDRQDVIFVRVNCWGFDNSQSVLEYVVRMIIKGMTDAGLETDHLIGIPRQYIQALEKTHTIFDVICKIFWKKQTPEDALNKIDDTLWYENKNLVLILDDLDRISGELFQLDSVIATLRRLRDTKHISFILTWASYGHVDTKKTKIDFMKICDYADETPILSYRDKFDCLEKVSKHHNVGILRPQVKEHADNLLLSSSEPPYRSSLEWRALLDLIETPRELKTIIRELDAAWENLRGECDYMELLSLTILRFVDDFVFRYVVENLHSLRSRTGEINSDGINKKYKNTLEWLFPKREAANSLDIMVHFPNPVNYNQSRRICNEGFIDYFTRIVNEQVFEGERDQEQLRAIEDWKNGNNKDALVAIFEKIDSRNIYVLTRWFADVDITVEDVKEIFINRILQLPYPSYAVMALRHLMLLRLQEQSSWRSIMQYLLERMLENNEQRPVAYQLAGELIFRNNESIDSHWGENHDKTLLEPNDKFKELDIILQGRLLTELSRGSDPVVCSEESETRTRISDIGDIKKSAQGLANGPRY